MATGIDLGKYKLGWHDNTSDYVNTPKKGINEQDVAMHKPEAMKAISGEDKGDGA